MAKRKKKLSKAHIASVRLKTSFAIQSTLLEIDNLKRVMKGLPELSEGGENPFIQLLEETLIESLDIIFPEPFEA